MSRRRDERLVHPSLCLNNLSRQQRRAGSLRGIISFTYAALFDLQIKPGMLRPLHQFRQLQQILILEQTPSRGHRHKRIGGDRRGPARRNRAQAALRVVEVNSILAPVMAIGDQLEALAFQWMVRVNDLEGCGLVVAMRCS
jgi:hypothetical protein